MDAQVFKIAIKDAQESYGEAHTAKQRDALLFAIKLLKQRYYRECEQEKRNRLFEREENET